MLDRIKLLPWHWYAIAIAVIVLDQITKVWASNAFVLHETAPVFPGFNWVLRHNYGAAFSFLADSGGWQVWFLGTLATGASIAISIWIAKLGKAFSFETLGLALVLGGAVGNLIDRVAYGYVVDFIEFYYRESYWPAFNVADMAITGGAMALLYDAVFGKKQKQDNK